MPLPAGTIRLYKKDDKGNQQFIGEDRIDHTPKDEDVRVKSRRRIRHRGRAEANRLQGDCAERLCTPMKSRFAITRNGPITVVVNEPIGGDWEMISSTFEAKTAAFAAQFNVPVEDGEATLSYRIV